MRKYSFILFLGVGLFFVFSAKAATVTQAGDNQTDWAANVVVTISSGITQGHGAVVLLYSNKDCASAANGISGVTDSAGNSYSRDASYYIPGNSGACIYSAYINTAIAAGNSSAQSTAASATTQATPPPPAGNNIYIAQNQAGANSGADCSNAHSLVWFNTATNWGCWR